MTAAPPAQPVRAVVVTNIPAPYRIPVYELLDDRTTVDLQVVYLAERESNRLWDLPDTTVRSTTLRHRVLRWQGRYIHFTSGVSRALSAARPDVVVVTGFNPPQLVALARCIVRGTPYVLQTDGTVRSEARLTRVHGVIRRVAARRAASFAAASAEGDRLVRSWSASVGQVHRSPLAIDNRAFASDGSTARDLDLLFSGQLTEVKQPLFALDVAQGVARRLGRRVTIAFLGAGPLLPELQAAAARAEGVDVQIAGFQQQDALPAWFTRARVFLFPTRWDPWGLVANEAAAAGTPTIVSPDAGAAGELVVDGEGGRVLPLDRETWIEAATILLTEPETWAATSAAAVRAVAPFSQRAAAEGLRDAIVEAHLTRRERSRKSSR